VILDGVGGDLGTAAFDLIEEGGRFSAHGTPSGSFAALGADEVESRGITVTSIADLQYGGGDRTRLIAAALDEVEAGRAAPLIGQMFALGDASKAHMAIESRETIAKTILVPGEG
jgi:NADPH2:quinone reductase